MIEIFTFQLAEGADEEAFLAADKRLQTGFAYQQPGLLRRTTGRGEDGRWVVVELWRSAADADACDARWGDDPLGAEFMTFVDASSRETSRWFELE
ncbi:MAG: hypothetical protein ACRDWW_07375 [Acidimicrobiales bacterium]